MIKPFSLLFNSQRILKKETVHGPVPSDGELLKKTLKMAWPSMLESFLIAVVSFIDTLMVSTLGDYAVASVGLVTQPRMLCLAVFMGLTPAVSALVARRRGEGDRDSANRVLRMSLIITIVLIAIISTCAVVFADPIIDFAGSEADTHPYAVAYFKIIAGGLVFNVLTMIINGAQRGVGNTKIAMRTNLVSNLVNICFNYLLIGGNLGFPRLGVAGAAIATVIGSAAALVMALISVMHRQGYLCLFSRSGGIFEKRSLSSMLSIGGSTFLEQIFLRVGFFLYAKIVASLGTVMLTAHQIGMQVMNISFSFADGLSVAAVALVGYSLGEKRPDLAKVYGLFCQRIGILCSLALSVVYLTLGGTIFSLFSDTPEVIEMGRILMSLMTVIVLFQISQLIFAGCLRGSGDAKFTALVSFVNIGILRPGLAFLFVKVLQFGLVGAWVGIILDQFVRLLMTSIRFSRGKWMQIKI